MKVHEYYLHLLRCYAREKNLSKSKFAQEANLDTKTLKLFWEKDWEPTLKTLKKLEAIIPETFKPQLPSVNHSVNKKQKGKK
jgi:ribosome-binding protein aMBF1 (putative translation factor)